MTTTGACKEACASSSFPKYSFATELAVRGGRSDGAILPFVAGESGFKFEDVRRYCGVLPLVLLRLDVDLREGGVFCLSPLNLATEGDREGGLGESDFVLVVAG